MDILCKADYEEEIAKSRPQRMKWWREARFGMFIHYGLYSSLQTHEWSMAFENYTIEEYEKAVPEDFNFDKDAPRKWVALAKKAGMKYVVLTTRHHDGFSLWNSKVNPFNATTLGPKCDVVKEFVDACRAEDMKIGFYFSLMDWHHEDGWRCAFDPDSRRRFTQYLQGMLRELMTNYGKIDILWYDIPRPMAHHEGWDSLAMNQMVRGLQPDIIINNRSLLEEDFSTPEESIIAGEKDWEACMTFNGISWGYIDHEATVPYSYNAHQIARMLCKAAAGGGNLLLNIGPMADGTIPPETIEPLSKIGAWLSANGEAVYGPKVPTCVYRANGLCSASENAEYVYIWNWIWPPDGQLRLGGFLNKLVEVQELATGENIPFVQNENRIVLGPLPAKSPDKELSLTVFRLKFEDAPQYARGYLYPQLHQGRQYKPKL